MASAVAMLFSSFYEARELIPFDLLGVGIMLRTCQVFHDVHLVNSENVIYIELPNTRL